MKNNNYSAYDIYIYKTGFQIHSICSCGYIDSFIPALCHFICFIPAIYLSLDIYHSFLFVVDFGGCLCACSNSLLFHHSDNLLALIPVGVSSKKKRKKATTTFIWSRRHDLWVISSVLGYIDFSSHIVYHLYIFFFYHLLILFDCRQKWTHFCIAPTHQQLDFTRIVTRMRERQQ